MDLDLDLEDMRFAGMLAEGFRCRECKLAPPPFARAVAYGVYDGELRTLIHLLKYGGAPARRGPAGWQIGLVHVAARGGRRG